MDDAQARPSRRFLCFESIGELAADVDRIVAAQQSGRLRAGGNWTAAQIFDHLARFIEGSYDGFEFRAAWPVRAASHVAKWVAWKRFVDWSLRPGFRVPHTGLEPDEWADFDVATARLRAQLERIQGGEEMRQPSPFEGAISHDQWVYVHLRHAELHLGFLDFDERA